MIFLWGEGGEGGGKREREREREGGREGGEGMSGMVDMVCKSISLA